MAQHIQPLAAFNGDVFLSISQATNDKVRGQVGNALFEEGDLTRAFSQDRSWVCSDSLICRRQVRICYLRRVTFFPIRCSSLVGSAAYLSSFWYQARNNTKNSLFLSRYVQDSRLSSYLGADGKLESRYGCCVRLHWE